MFDCCSVRFSNVRLCSIGKILWLCSIVKILGWVWLSSIEVNRTIEVRLPIFGLVTLSNVVWGEKKADTNAEKDRANRGHAQLKPSLPSFSLYSKVLMSITLLRFKFQNATKFGNYLRFSIFFLGLLKISRRRREVQWQNWGDILVMLADLLLKFHNWQLWLSKKCINGTFFDLEKKILGCSRGSDRRGRVKNLRGKKKIEG